MQVPHLRILCTEDDPDTRALLTLILSDGNCEVITSETHASAVDLARTTHFDLYLLDNWVSGMSGIEMCETLRGFDTQTPILFYSAAAYPQDKAKAYASGAQSYLTKPVDNEELIAEVLRLVSESRKAQQGNSRNYEQVMC